IDEGRPRVGGDGRGHRSAAGAIAAPAGGSPAQVPTSRGGIAMRSPRTALDVAGPPAPGPLKATVPTGIASTSIRFSTPDVRPKAEPAGTGAGRADGAMRPASSTRAVARSLITLPAARADSTSAARIPVIP